MVASKARLNSCSPKPLSLVVTFFLFLLSTAVFAEEITSAQYATVLNLSGKQRMLTQKMSKEVMLVALEVDKANNLANLAKTSALFDKTLNGLKNGDSELKLPPTTSERILRQLGKIEAIWADFYPAVRSIIDSGSASEGDIGIISEKNIPLLKQMNKAVGLYEKDSAKGAMKDDTGAAATINLSGKQRMLTQKMSKEFLLVAYGHDTENNKLSLLETYDLFERTLNGLYNGDETLGLPGTQSDSIRGQLDVVKNLWKEFKPYMEKGSNGESISKETMADVARINLPLLKEMNKAVGMYEMEVSK